MLCRLAFQRGIQARRGPGYCFAIPVTKASGAIPECGPGYCFAIPG